MIIHRGAVVVTFATALFIILIVRILFVLLAQVSLQLMISLGESFNYCGKGLHLLLQGVGWLFELLVNGSN